MSKSLSRKWGGGSRDPAMCGGYYITPDGRHRTKPVQGRVSRTCKHCGSRIIAIDWAWPRFHHEAHERVYQGTIRRNQEAFVKHYAKWGSFPAGSD